MIFSKEKVLGSRFPVLISELRFVVPGSWSQKTTNLRFGSFYSTPTIFLTILVVRFPVSLERFEDDEKNPERDLTFNNPARSAGYKE